MMVIWVGSWMFRELQRCVGWFMMIQATTVFLALIGTTLSLLEHRSRVTYAMGRDEELGSLFGILHSKTFSPHRCHLDPGDHLRGHWHRLRVDSPPPAAQPTARLL